MSVRNRRLAGLVLGAGSAGGAIGAAYLGLLRRDGTLWSWGANNYGQVGNGTLAITTSAATSLGLPAVQAGRGALPEWSDREQWRNA